MSEDLIDRLRIVSNMINMGERISWGQETTLMDEAAAEITRLRAKVEAADKLDTALWQIVSESDVSRDDYLAAMAAIAAYSEAHK